MREIGEVTIKGIGISKVFLVKPNPIKVLNGIDLEVRTGEYTIIFGPSGVGKSTLLNILMGLEMPTEGKVELFGQDITNSSEDEKAALRKEYLGIVYQQPNWIKSLDVIENVAFPLSLNGILKEEALARAHEAISLFGLEDWSHFYPAEMSAGQQQKIALARALVLDPKVIIADEPTGNLDYTSGKELTQILATLAARGKSVLMVTHDLENLGKADRIIRIFDGGIVSEIYPKRDGIVDIRKYIIEGELKRKEPVGIPEIKNVDLPREHKSSLQRRLSENFRKPIHLLQSIKSKIKSVSEIVQLIFLLLTSLLFAAYLAIISSEKLPNGLRKKLQGLESTYDRWLNFMEHNDDVTIKYHDLFNLAIKNTFGKKIRAVVTIGGVAVGIGFTVFLISLGYGVEKLVIERVAKLDQLVQVEVLPAPSAAVKINDKVLDDFSKIKGVVDVQPNISVAAKVNYKASSADAVAYGVQSKYLNSSGFPLQAGKYFEGDRIIVQSGDGASLGVETKLGRNDNVAITNYAPKETVVNLAFLKLLNLSPNDAIGQDIDITYSFGSTQFDLADNAAELVTVPESYKIIGVVDNKSAPLLYIPIVDVKSVGVANYSQVRIIAENQADISNIRKSLEILGYRTTAVVDTVAQIESFFSSARVIFAIIGLVALFIASLGMFNTLTISLLERTREVGLMKAIGMRSDEVNRLFLTESLTLGILGGFGGILLGVVFGVIASLIVTIISLPTHQGFIMLNFLPLQSIILVFGISIITSLLTGYYPSKRARRISPLNALRYE